MSDETQEFVDRFYWSSGGRCCAGCDNWRHLNSTVGECLAGPPVGEAQRFAMIGMTSWSLPAGAGHVLTDRAYKCGAFLDTFDWSSLPLAYQKRIGAPRVAP